MEELVATNIRLPRSKLKALKLKAVEESKSLSQLIREIIENICSDKEIIENKDIKRDTFFKIVGMYESGIKDGSINHDKHIYQGKNER